jgi:MoaA/NifB/PqqE/SkfB family radical SAM enzyme
MMRRAMEAARPRLVLVWRATERCDTACGFCAYDARLKRSRRELDATEAIRFGTLVGTWAAARGREVLLSWLGGEPFLWPPLVEVSRTLAASGLRLALTTNGRALAEARWRRFVVDSLAELTVSLDGPPRVHDRLRRRAGLGGGVLEAIAAIATLGANEGRRPLVRVNTVLLRDNLASFGELVRLVADAGADELTFNALGGNDRPEYFAEQGLRREDVAFLAGALPAIRAEAAARGLVVRGGDAYVARLAASAAGVPVPIDDCAPGRDFWFVEVDGRLAPCSFTVATYGVPIAALERGEDLDELPARLARARRAARAHVCDDCPSTQVHAKFVTP